MRINNHCAVEVRNFGAKIDMKRVKVFYIFMQNNYMLALFWIAIDSNYFWLILYQLGLSIKRQICPAAVEIKITVPGGRWMRYIRIRLV